MAYFIIYTPEFKRDYKKLSDTLKEQLKLKGSLFEQNPFHPVLRTHKLSGRLRGNWSFSIDFKHRVIFQFINTQEILLLRAGDHSVYRNK
ncbi:MAG: type II toxin-antitoxin system mRNA interferase toxin, RelE/StbE family [Patescibacteria group bacterium]|nr:type II toxin-antitoxin system mRNA interferase toxin, RelE/StbE family [Patescibacteria group bacterium]MBU2508759.1 type II toxin-antitoxin system mRNA interferase toxin, RelE/StbE family [Patescibacteria group bacterium]